jgi:hypothetical protein
MAKSNKIIKDLIKSSNDFELTSQIICRVLDAIKEEDEDARVDGIYATLIAEHDKRKLPHPEVARRAKALEQLPDLIKPLIIAAITDQIKSVGEVSIPARREEDNHDGDFVINENEDVFSEQVIARYGICCRVSQKPEGYDEAEMKISMAGILKSLFDSHGCGDIYFTVRLEAEEHENELILDDAFGLEYIFRRIAMHIKAQPHADNVEKLVEHLKTHLSRCLLLQTIKYSEV